MNKPDLILLVDDDEITNFINKTILKDLFPESNVIAFINPIIALDFLIADYIEKPTPAIIFLDINMPQMSGWEFLVHIEQHKQIFLKYVHFFILSSSVAPSDKTKSTDNPLVKDFVSKPLSKKLIQNLLQT